MQIGDKVRLNWNGFPQLPKWLDGDEAEIIGFGRTLIVVQPKHAARPYKIRRDQMTRKISR